MTESRWERSIPFFSINEKIVQHLFKAFDPSHTVASFAPLPEGCRNTNYILHIRNSRARFLLRIFPAGEDSWKKEQRLLQLLRGEIPVQQLYFIGRSEAIEGRTYGIYEYVEGTSLQAAFAKGFTADGLLMRELALALASIHNHPYPVCGFLDQNLRVEAVLPPLVQWYSLFMGEHARARLGDELTAEIEERIAESSAQLCQIEQSVTLVHGDFRPPNLLIQDGRLRCILDWEFAMAGHPLSDLAQLFRRQESFSVFQRERFERVYREHADFQLPDNWFHLGQLRDLANLLQMINSSSHSPYQYADLRSLIKGIAAELR